MITWKKHFTYLADYQHWANENLFQSLDHLTDTARKSEQELFYGSIHHTIDHLLAQLRVWQGHLQGRHLDINFKQVQIHDWRELKMCLQKESRQFQHWLEAQPDVFFEMNLEWTGSEGHRHENWSRDMLTHLFADASQWRGQVAAVATRLGAPFPQLDFIEYKRQMSDCLDELALLGSPYQE